MFYCYILWNEKKTHTYAGYTVNPIRRLRQHNSEIVGGAQYTKRMPGPWKFLFLIECDSWTKNQALSFEYYLKSHGRKKRQGLPGCPVLRRFNLLKRALSHDKFTDLTFTLTVDSDFFDFAFE